MRSPLGRSGRRRAALAAALSLLAAPLRADDGLSRTEEAIEARVQRGPVVVTLTLSPPEPRFGDVLTLELAVTAQPQVEVLMPEFGEALERFAILDFQARDEIDDEGRAVLAQRYHLEVARSGPAALPPLGVEFRDGRPDAPAPPPGEDAFWVETPRVPFEVASVLPDDVVSELRPLPDSLAARIDPAAVRWRVAATVAVALALVAAIGALGVVLWRRAGRTSAYDRARAELDALAAQGLPGDSRVGAWYVELSGLLRRYLEDRFQLRSPELTTEEFLEAAAASESLTAGWRAALRRILTQADLVKFAGLRPGPEEIRATLRETERFLDETRPDGGPQLARDSDPPTEAPPPGEPAGA